MGIENFVVYKTFWNNFWYIKDKDFLYDTLNVLNYRNANCNFQFQCHLLSRVLKSK